MMAVSDKVRVGYLPNPYKLDFAYTDGRCIGKPENIRFDEPDPGHLRPYIESFMREEIELELVRADEGRGGDSRC